MPVLDTTISAGDIEEVIAKRGDRGLFNAINDVTKTGRLKDTYDKLREIVKLESGDLERGSKLETLLSNTDVTRALKNLVDGDEKAALRELGKYGKDGHRLLENLGRRVKAFNKALIDEAKSLFRETRAAADALKATAGTDIGKIEAAISGVEATGTFDFTINSAKETELKLLNKTSGTTTTIKLPKINGESIDFGVRDLTERFKKATDAAGKQEVLTDLVQQAKDSVEKAADTWVTDTVGMFQAQITDQKKGLGKIGEFVSDVKSELIDKTHVVDKFGKKAAAEVEKAAEHAAPVPAAGGDGAALMDHAGPGWKVGALVGAGLGFGAAKMTGDENSSTMRTVAFTGGGAAAGGVIQNMLGRVGKGSAAVVEQLGPVAEKAAHAIHV